MDAVQICRGRGFTLWRKDRNGRQVMLSPGCHGDSVVAENLKLRYCARWCYKNDLYVKHSRQKRLNWRLKYSIRRWVHDFLSLFWRLFIYIQTSETSFMQMVRSTWSCLFSPVRKVAWILTNITICLARIDQRITKEISLVNWRVSSVSWAYQQFTPCRSRHNYAQSFLENSVWESPYPQLLQ